MAALLHTGHSPLHVAQRLGVSRWTVYRHAALGQHGDGAADLDVEVVAARRRGWQQADRRWRQAAGDAVRAVGAAAASRHLGVAPTTLYDWAAAASA